MRSLQAQGLGMPPSLLGLKSPPPPSTARGGLGRGNGAISYHTSVNTGWILRSQQWPCQPRQLRTARVLPPARAASAMAWLGVTVQGERAVWGGLRLEGDLSRPLLSPSPAICLPFSAHSHEPQISTGNTEPTWFLRPSRRSRTPSSLPDTDAAVQSEGSSLLGLVPSLGGQGTPPSPGPLSSGHLQQGTPHAAGVSP